MADITAANAVFAIAVDTLFPVPVILQGFAADDVFDTDPLDSAETVMGVDGRLSAGFVFREVRQTVTLQADSPSMALFDFWWASMQAQRSVFFATGAVTLNALGTKWALTNGILHSYKPMPDVKRILQPRKFGLTWESVSPAVTV